YCPASHPPEEPGGGEAGQRMNGQAGFRAWSPAGSFLASSSIRRCCLPGLLPARSSPARRSGGVSLEGVLGGALQELVSLLAGDGAGDRDLGGQRIDGLLEQVALGEARRGAARVAHDGPDDLDAVGETARLQLHLQRLDAVRPGSLLPRGLDRSA